MQPETIGTRYRVLRAIGQGGMGTVWLCRDETLAREVAVKQVGLLPGESVPDSARALREARSSAALNHRNVVTVFDIVEESGAVWMVMEHVPSRTLSELIRDEGALPPERVAAIGAQVADGLAAAHAAGTTHRDVKPGNVLVRDDGLAKIGDFGIARTVGDPALTQSGFVTGTPSYFSPELARGADPEPPADVWALGATLYAAVEGRPPYRSRSNPMSVLAEIGEHRPPPPQQAGVLETALTRMLDPDPATRWTMADAAHHLHRLADAAESSTSPGTVAFTRPNTDDTATRPAATPPPRAPAPAPAPPPADDDHGGRRKRGAWLAALVAAAALLVIGGVALASTLGDDETGSPDKSAGADPSPSPSEKPSRTPSEKPSEEPTTAEASPTDEDTPSPAPAAGSSAQVAFLDDYFATAPQDQDAGWAMLSPDYQAETGRSSYDGFWSTVESADASGFSPVRGEDAVDLTVSYVYGDGRTVEERQRVYLVPSGDGGWLIDGYDTI